MLMLLLMVSSLKAVANHSFSTMPIKRRRLTNELRAVEMRADELIFEIEAAAPEEGDENGLPFQDDAMEDAPARTTFLDYLKSPVITLLVGQGDEQALLTAHQALLVTSPWFAEACESFSDEISVCASSPPFHPSIERWRRRG